MDTVSVGSINIRVGLDIIEFDSDISDGIYKERALVLRNEKLGNYYIQLIRNNPNCLTTFPKYYRLSSNLKGLDVVERLENADSKINFYGRIISISELIGGK